MSRRGKRSTGLTRRDSVCFRGNEQPMERRADAGKVETVQSIKRRLWKEGTDFVKCERGERGSDDGRRGRRVASRIDRYL